MILDKLIFYNVDKDSLLYQISDMLYDNVDVDRYYTCLSSLINFGIKHGFNGNLWHAYIAYFLIYNENTYSILREHNLSPLNSIDDCALNDIAIMRQIYELDITVDNLGFDMSFIYDFDNSAIKSSILSKDIIKSISILVDSLDRCKNDIEFKNCIDLYYKQYGMGTLGVHKAFRLDDNGDIIPINAIKYVTLDDLYGYDIQKEKLINNTEAFVSDKKANNCLLYGDSGTGKSTSIKALANMYYDKGLRIIEIYKHQFKYLNKIISTLKNRNYYFIIYMDDLSFEEYEVEYKYLKAVIEGGLENTPSNIRIYATSNRRHLIKESFNDNSEIFDLHSNDTKEEKLSLADRFGVSIYYPSPSPNEWKNIVLSLRDNSNIDMRDDYILSEANKWEISHNGRNGRSARQFIDYLSGNTKKDTVIGD